MQKATVTTTMGPGIPVDPNRTRNLRWSEEAPGLSLTPARPGEAAPAISGAASPRAGRGRAAVLTRPSIRARSLLLDQRPPVVLPAQGRPKVPQHAGGPRRCARVPPDRRWWSAHARPAPCAGASSSCPRRRLQPGTRPRKEAHGKARQGSSRRRAHGEVPQLERRRAHRVPRPDRGAAHRAAPRRSASTPPTPWSKNTLTKIAATEAGVDGLDEPARRPDRDRLRHRRPGRGGQGPARLRQGQPAAGDQGRRARRQAADRRRDHQARRPRVPRGAAGQAGRRHEGVADQGRDLFAAPLSQAARSSTRCAPRSRQRARPDAAPAAADADAAGRRDAAAGRRRRRHGWRRQLSPARRRLTDHTTATHGHRRGITTKGTPPWRSSAPTSCSTRSRR